MQMEIYSKRLLLRPLYIEDITQTYEQWLNNPDITKYLEIRHSPQTYEVICAYINSYLEDTIHKRYWGVFEKSSDLHIGSIVLNAIHCIYKTADISFVIGHPEAQGKGYATEAVHAVCDYAFAVMELHKITGGHYASHIGSKRVFEKNGFRQECLQREQVINSDGLREDIVRHGLLKREFLKKEKYFS